ncbi:hypothetical protein [Marinobacter mangrovi]|uniref:hypothetical protein n=1 Tax=Marinobacter mangrovi TaxID=2803918 RepID=UPI001933B4C6|nr:hypothetical protein [Marinobacter mangrovi]
MIKDFDRINISTGELGKGDLFIGPDGQQIDLEHINVLWTGVDTIRQLYEGKLRPQVIAEVIAAYESGIDAQVSIKGIDFKVQSGKRGGYRYLLQNREYGLTILVGSFYREPESYGSHLKIECSPRWIYERGTDELCDELTEWGMHFLEAIKPTGIAIHLACDFQGWQPPEDFASHFVTRAKTVSVHNGISDLHFQGLDGATVNGRGETYTFGKANSLQVCLYDKSKEIDVSDKRAFMEGIWECAVSEKSFPETCYDPELPVWRLEVRFHHRIVNEIWQGTSGIDPIYTFAHANKHLTGLWQHALGANRYEAKREWVHPIWTKLREDVNFGHAAPPIHYKRVKKQPGCGNEKNVSLAFGNLLSIYARNQFSVKQAWDCLKKSGLWEDLCNYYRRREIYENELYQLVRDGLVKRRLLGKVAA